MLLRTALESYKRVGEYRSDLYTLAKSKGISHTNFIDLSQQLDNEITILQKIMQEVNPLRI